MRGFACRVWLSFSKRPGNATQSGLRNKMYGAVLAAAPLLHATAKPALTGERRIFSEGFAANAATTDSNSADSEALSTRTTSRDCERADFKHAARASPAL